MAKQQYTEQELIKGCKKKKRHFQELLYKQFYGFGMAVCLRYSYSRDDALEILNDSFMKVFEHIQSFDDNKPFKSWFRRILVNTSLDHHRANKRHRIQLSLEELQAETSYVADHAGNNDLYPDLGIELILSLFDRLPETYRLAFNLYEVEGYSHDEIAALLGISPGTSRSNLSRAKKMLRLLYFKSQNKTHHEAV